MLRSSQCLDSSDIGVSVSGVAVYVYFILANNQGEGITTTTETNFTLDGVVVSTFTHNPTTSFDLEYNQLVFSQTDLDNTEHTLKASISGVDHDVYINFDYANYTYVSFFLIIIIQPDYLGIQAMLINSRKRKI